MPVDADALIIGAGPAGASTAIWLAQAGWRVILVEQQRYPRQKVCGECIAAGALVLLDQLGIGDAFDRLAGEPIRQVGWMSAGATVVADMPACMSGPHRYGRALGRDTLDALLLERARALGVVVLQPVKVRAVSGLPGRFECQCEWLRGVADSGCHRLAQTLRARIVVDAHGSWEHGPAYTVKRSATDLRLRPARSDLFAFKASFQHARLPTGFLPVLALGGGYGGMVVAEQGRLTVACCVRRDALRKWRALTLGASAGVVIETHLRSASPAISATLEPAQRDGAWLAVGPVRPGTGTDLSRGLLRVGNAAGEAHPLVGEGIAMALQSAALLVRHLTPAPLDTFDARRSLDIQRAYAAAWRREIGPRLASAAAFAQLAMNPALTAPTGAMLRRWPMLLTVAAQLAGKARHRDVQFTPTREPA